MDFSDQDAALQFIYARSGPDMAKVHASFMKYLNFLGSIGECVPCGEQLSVQMLRARLMYLRATKPSGFSILNRSLGNEFEERYNRLREKIAGMPSIESDLKPSSYLAVEKEARLSKEGGDSSEDEELLLFTRNGYMSPQNFANATITPDPFAIESC